MSQQVFILFIFSFILNVARTIKLSFFEKLAHTFCSIIHSSCSATVVVVMIDIPSSQFMESMEFGVQGKEDWRARNLFSWKILCVWISEVARRSVVVRRLDDDEEWKEEEKKSGSKDGWIDGRRRWVSPNNFVGGNIISFPDIFSHLFILSVHPSVMMLRQF